MKAKDLMTKEVIFAKPDETIKEVLLKMLKNNISGLPILDNEKRVIGILSQTDIVRLSEKYKKEDLENMKVNQIIKGRKKKLIVAKPNTPIKRLIRLMVKHDISRIPIVDSENKILGIVTKTDILKLFLSNEENIEETIQTTIDKILKILDERNQIFLKDLAKELKEPESVIENTLKILEKYGIVELTYSLGKVLIRKK